jgi:serine/threonine protein kinase
MRLKLIREPGRLFSSTRHQVHKINYYAEKINHFQQFKPQEALKYTDKLIDYIQKIMNEKKISKTVQQWLEDNSPEETKKKIEAKISNKTLRKSIHRLSMQAHLPSIYDEYQDKDSFKRLIENQLNDVDEHLKVEPIDAGNNPLVKVTNQDMAFVVRLIRMDKEEELAGTSPRQIREKLGRKIPQIPQPFVMEWVEDDGQEITYMEYSELYTEGNLQEHFEDLHKQRKQKALTPDEFDKEIFLYAKQMITMFIALNKKDIWYTDLKPSNILLKNNNIVVSDIKGLVASTSTYIRTNSTNTSKTYYQSDVFNQKTIDLEMVQCQTLAATLYQLACGELPEQVDIDQFHWKNVFNFKHPVFTGENGKFLRATIERLMSINTPSMQHVLTQFDEKLMAVEAVSQEVREPMLDMPLPEENDVPYYKM